MAAARTVLGEPHKSSPWFLVYCAAECGHCEVAVALCGCYSRYDAPPPAPVYSYSDYRSYGGYYYGPSASFGFYGNVPYHDEDDGHHGEGD